MLFSATSLFASNLRIAGGKVSNFLAGATEISFTISQENTFSTNTYTCSTDTVKDCAWIFVKYSTNSEAGPWNHCTITGASAGDAAGATIQSVSDSKGAFIFSNGNNRYWESNNVKVRWNYVTDGFSVFPSSGVKFRVMGIEMVYISTGPFTYDAGGSANTYNSSYNNFGAGSQVIVGAITDVPTGCSTDWPNGYRAFYIAKYEVSQKQYADFLNTIDPNGTSGTTYYDSARYNQAEYFLTRDISRPIGDRYYVTGGHDTLACNYTLWSDVIAYASWSGLRPMTEMEFERAARGCNNANKYPWGNTEPDISTLDIKSSSTYTTSFTCCLYFQNGSLGVSFADGPAPVGLYLSGLNISGLPQYRTPEQTGASPYGIADLGGNLREITITCPSLTTPINGNGTLTVPTSWPLSGAAGVGDRGGSWMDWITQMKVSDRSQVNWYYVTRNYFDRSGIRPARTP